MQYQFGTEDEFEALSDDRLVVTPTSRVTGDATPIELKLTDSMRFRFLPKLVNNHKDPAKSVEGKLVFERKRKADEGCPSDCEQESERISRRNVKTGDWLELSLDTSETFALFTGLGQLYQLYESVGIPYVPTEYVGVDSASSQVLSLLKNDPSAVRLLAEDNIFELVKTLLRLVTQSESVDALSDTLKSLEEDNIQRLSTTLNVEQLERAAEEFRSSLDNSEEEYWQKSLFGKYPWILSQLFASPLVLHGEKAYVGGKLLSNRGGNICDFIYRNRMTNNVCLIEIKTPLTELVGIPYRQTYSLSTELSGAVNQVLNYRDQLMKSYHSLVGDGGDRFEAFFPKCAIVIGRVDRLSGPAAIAAFETFRNSLNGVTIITYDELLQRTADLIAILQSDAT